MTPAEEILEAARRGLQAIIDGLRTTNLYERGDFSDLRVIYNNIFQTAIRARKLEDNLSKHGVNFETDDFPTEADIEEWQREFDLVAGVPDYCRGQVEGPLVSAIETTINGNSVVATSDVGGTSRPVLKFSFSQNINRVSTPPQGSVSSDSFLPE